MRYVVVAAISCAVLAGPAFGAFTADTISGFETGDLLECSATVGTPTVVTGSARTGERGLLTDSTGDESCAVSHANPVGSGDEYLYGFCLRVTDATPAFGGGIVLRLRTAADTWELQLHLVAAGTLTVVDSTFTNVLAGTIALQDNTFHCIELYVHHADSGAVELFVDGVSDGTASGDFDLSGDAVDVQLVHQNDTAGPVDFDDLYVFANVTDATDRCSVDATRLCEVFWFSGGPASVTPDTGSDLDLGQWVNLSEMPLNASSGSEYTTTSVQSGSVLTDDVGTGSCSGGPNGCAEFDGTSIAGNWLLYAERSGGGATTMRQRYGNSVDALTDTIDLVLATAPLMKRQVSAAAAILPTDSEYCEIGIVKESGGRDYEPWEQWCYVLHLPPAAGGGDELMVIGAL